MIDNSDFYDNSQDYYICDICEEKVKDIKDKDFSPFEFVCEECSSKLMKCNICGDWFNPEDFTTTIEQDICENCILYCGRHDECYSKNENCPICYNENVLKLNKTMIKTLLEEQCDIIYNEINTFIKSIEKNESLIDNLFTIIKKSLEYEKLFDRLNKLSMENIEYLGCDIEESSSLRYNLLKEIFKNTTLTQTINLQQEKDKIEVINRVDADTLQIILREKSFNFNFYNCSFDELKIKVESILRLNNIEFPDKISYELISASNVFELKKVAENIPSIGFDNVNFFKTIYEPVEVAINKDVLKGEEIREIQLKL
jgi:hypothetical protein